MNNQNDFEERMANNSNEELVNIVVNERFRYVKEAVDCAERHLLNRGVDLSELISSVKFKENGQALIDEAYNYGVHLIDDKGVDYIRLKDELIFKGLDTQEALTVVNKIEKDIKKPRIIERLFTYSKGHPVSLRSHRHNCGASRRRRPILS